MKPFKFYRYTIEVMSSEGYLFNLYRDNYKDILPLKVKYDVRRIRNNHKQKDIPFVPCYKKTK